MATHWKDRPFTVTVELYLHEGRLHDFFDDRPVPEIAPPAGLTPDDALELVLDCESTGYYDPGRYSGPPESCYPSEGDDERELVAARLIGPAGEVEIAADLLPELREHFAAKIESAEIDTTADEPDYEPDYD